MIMCKTEEQCSVKNNRLLDIITAMTLVGGKKKDTKHFSSKTHFK